MLRRDQRYAGIDEFLLRVDDIERRTLTHPRLFAHAVERDLRGIDLRRCRLDLILAENLRQSPVSP